MYRVSDFAEKAGVTVRTLHHYDRLGLLKPSGRTRPAIASMANATLGDCSRSSRSSSSACLSGKSRTCWMGATWIWHQLSGYKDVCCWKSGCNWKPPFRRLKKPSVR